MNETLRIAYFVTIGVAAIVFYAFWSKLRPKAKKRWHPRLMLIGLLVMSSFLLAFALAARDPLFVAGFCVAIVLAALTIRQTRVCAACGTVAPARSVLVPASFCPKCGEALTPTRLLGGDS